MHLHAEHSVFFEKRETQRGAAFSLGLTVTMLGINAGAGSTAASLGGAVVGMALLFCSCRDGLSRLKPALAWALVVMALVMFAGLAPSADQEAFIRAGARTLCGIVWVLWLGTRIDWPTLRLLMLRAGVPASVTGTLDHALRHGLLTWREWDRRRDAAHTRLGSARLPVGVWTALLGEGALAGFIRLEKTEESAVVRSSTPRTNPAPAVLSLEAVDLRRGNQLALRQVDLRLAPGEWLAVCGPSGAGKSSLLRLLAGLEAPSSGRMVRLGSSISAGSPLRERLDGRVALLGQNPEHHFIANTVAEDIIWGLVHRGVEPAEAQLRASSMAEVLGIASLLPRPCHELSFGEQRRVALAGILVTEPALLLLDEPTAGLDPVAAVELSNLVSEVVGHTGATCIWATHDLHALPPSANRLLLLRDQAVVFDGPVGQGLTPRLLERAGLAIPVPARPSF